MIFTRGLFFKTKNEYDSEFILSPIENLDRDLYINLRIFIRFIIALPLCYYFGYFFKYNINNISPTSLSEIIVFVFNIIIIFILSFYILQIPHELLHYIVYSNLCNNNNNNNITVKLLNRKRLITTVLNTSISNIILILGLILPVLIITILISSILYINGFNFILYSILCANLILGAEDILNVFIALFSKHKGLYEIPNDYDYIKF